MMIASAKAPSLSQSPQAASAEAGMIDVVVESMVQEAEGVLGISFRAPDGTDLPAWTPGAHIDLRLNSDLERHYSLCGDPGDRSCFRIAVLREARGRGGSDWVHSRLRAGDVVKIRGPRNHFELVDAGSYLFIAGGIGITPLLPMVHEVARRGARWRLLYGGRELRSMAFCDELAVYGERIALRPEDQFGLLDLKGFLGEPRAGVAIYCCGPERLLEAVEVLGETWPDGTLRVERFQPRPQTVPGTARDFEVVLAKSGISTSVGPGESIIDALDRVGVHVPRSCGEGTCGTCLTPVLEGIPDHRDSFLMGKKRAANNAMCVCCSRSLTPRLVLNL